MTVFKNPSMYAYSVPSPTKIIANTITSLIRKNWFAISQPMSNYDHK